MKTITLDYALYINELKEQRLVGFNMNLQTKDILTSILSALNGRSLEELNMAQSRIYKLLKDLNEVNYEKTIS